ncbi:MAG: hypothetical protein ACLQJR_08520 [Stellaceae bacterium]
MKTIRIVEERAPYLLIAYETRFAVVERRNGKLYSLHCGRRAPAVMTDAGALAVVGKNWCDEKSARRVFSDIVASYAELAEHLW